MIPKTLHFIWAGGPSIMPVAGLRNVAAWADANPDHLVRIWVDVRTDRDVRARYPAPFDEYGVELVDIGEAGVETPEVRYELDALWPNHGAASDMLRYEILHREGGVYIDCLDVFPAPGAPLRDAGLPDLTFHDTYHSVARDATPLGTEAIACAAGHPSMRLLADTARASYHGNDWTHRHFTYAASSGPKAQRTWGQTPRLPLAELMKRRAIDTLHLTGPGMVLRTLRDPVVTTGWVALPADHELSWATAGVAPRAYDDALAAAVASIQFEVDNMRLFNYRLQLEHVVAATRASHERAQADLFERLRADETRFIVESRPGAAAEPLRSLRVR